MAGLVVAVALAYGANAAAQPTSAAPADKAATRAVHSTAIGAQAADARIRLTRVSPAYWRVTFASPPLNIVGPAEVRALVKIVEAIEASKEVKVVVFDSALPESFIAHYDLLKPLKDSTDMEPGPTGMHPVPDMMVRIARLPVVTISSIRGRATGIGSELILATDMRFASREKAILSQWEVGAGLVAGGGPMARLPRLVGRGRAMEILIASDDIDGDIAERYGYVNRALPDAELDGFVDAMARRIASFERSAIVETKKLVNVASLPPDAEMQPGWDAFIASVNRPETQLRLKALVDKGLQQPGEAEKNLGRATANYKP
ncbi:enoyl-CoA hydratase/isomerase family protein [Massilia sp. ML15P13]|uniref:Enoyl-CoA hydratase/isomerase family protein n=2 Tax=Telluria aromaticivorans TaxID=2725995 RepID=A0A7Y2K290_9BURK|nr:enoyl-CoA hydratase/isomerase family protein [Telluria aromaticivorans]